MNGKAGRVGSIMQSSATAAAAALDAAMRSLDETDKPREFPGGHGS